MNESASLALEVHPRLTPGAFLVSFCAHKKKLAARRNLAGAGGRDSLLRLQGPCPCRGTPPSGRCAAPSPDQGEATALSKEMGSEKFAPKGEAFG